MLSIRTRWATDVHGKVTEVESVEDGHKGYRGWKGPAKVQSRFLDKSRALGRRSQSGERKQGGDATAPPTAGGLEDPMAARTVSRVS